MLSWIILINRQNQAPVQQGQPLSNGSIPAVGGGQINSAPQDWSNYGTNTANLYQYLYDDTPPNTDSNGKVLLTQEQLKRMNNNYGGNEFPKDKKGMYYLPKNFNF